MGSSATSMYCWRSNSSADAADCRERLVRLNIASTRWVTPRSSGAVESTIATSDHAPRSSRHGRLEQVLLDQFAAPIDARAGRVAREEGIQHRRIGRRNAKHADVASPED